MSVCVEGGAVSELVITMITRKTNDLGLILDLYLIEYENELINRSYQYTSLYKWMYMYSQ